VRLDLFLKKTRLVRQREVAKSICDAGAAFVNGRAAKAAHSVQPGDRIELRMDRRTLVVRVVEVPHGNVARGDSGRYVEILSDAVDTSGWMD
jgi:ribosomal 50S subunit-recycling heat shock protein